MSSIFLAAFQLTLLLRCVTSSSPSGPAELLPALLSVGCLHPGLVSLAGTVLFAGRGYSLLLALLYPLLHRQPSQKPAVPSKPSKAPQFAARTDLICLLLFGSACLGFVRFADSVGAEGGGGREDEELGDIPSI